MIEPSTRDSGYFAPSSASVYTLAEPDNTPLPAVTRAPLDWYGYTWVEREPGGGPGMVHIEHSGREELRP